MVIKGFNRMKIGVAMSGGLDSSVAAALLKNAGHDVFGLTMLVVPLEEIDSDHVTTIAQQVAQTLDIPHHIMDLRSIFAERIISEFCEQYRHGRTPNPCVQCNRYIKFGVLYQKARELGADVLATGHYAQIERRESDGRYLLKKGIDHRRDQSYFLYALTQEQLSHTLFPLGTLTKDMVRQIAAEMKLPVSSAESREICFIPDNDYISFLRKHTALGTLPGLIKDIQGNVLGEHNGIINYTIGQRKRIGIAAKKPLYVVALDAKSNTVVVGDRQHIFNTECIVAGVNWIVIPELSESLSVRVKIRYLHPEAEAVVMPEKDGSVRIKINEPQLAITPGQSAVFYDGDMVVGGGTIEEVVQG
jgi:tRNA-specific 2-thiouridylase